MKNPSLPIGVFDSGVGGLTVVKEIIRQIPNESIVYFGDTAHVPYGSKSEDVVKKFSLQILNFLIGKKVKMIVVACNTASSYALESLRRKTSLPVLGVIEPAAKKAVYITKKGRIGVIGTEGTIRSKAYEIAIRKLNKNIEIFSVACPLFVPLVEEGWVDGSPNEKIVEDIAKKYLFPLKKNRIDTLILGCTHYPLIKNVIKRVIGDNVQLVDSANSCAEDVKKLLNSLGLSSEKSNRPLYKFYVSDAPEKFKTMGSMFLEKDISKVEKIDIERCDV